MRFSFSRRTVAGGEDKRVKKIPFLSIFRLKSKKNRVEYASNASSPFGDASSKQSPSILCPKVPIKGDAPFSSPTHSATQLNMQTPVVELLEENIYSRSPESDHELEDACCARPSRCPGFYEEDRESEECPAFEALNSSTVTPVSTASPFSQAPFRFTKTFARPSQVMTVSLDSIPEEIEVEEISTHDTPPGTPFSPLTHPSPDTATSSICSLSPRTSFQSELSMLNFENPCADFLPNGDPKETVAFCYESKGLGLFIPGAATLPNGILQSYPQLGSVVDDQSARSPSPLSGSLGSSPDPPRPSLGSSTSPSSSSASDFSSPRKESASISPATSVDQQQRSRRRSPGSDMSSKDCLKELDKWSLELKILQEKFQNLTSTTPMEALLGALFPEEYPHLASTSPSFASHSSSVHADILCESPVPTPSSSYLLPEPFASSPPMSDADSQDDWRCRISVCDIRELARRENERLERFGPQHSTAEELRLLDIAELSLSVPYRQ
ncbi:hypothetical protein FRB96_006509 [Tulasnella sp. 330]|nr:hypothetical protein FRB96_006509 [Tulasnella sp. 330]